MDEKTIELIVEQEDAGMRLDAYLREKTPFSRSRILSMVFRKSRLPEKQKPE